MEIYAKMGIHVRLTVSLQEKFKYAVDGQKAGRIHTCLAQVQNPEFWCLNIVVVTIGDSGKGVKWA